MTDETERWGFGTITTRWEAIRNPSEREAFLRYGHGLAPWESIPDYVERILKADPKITLENAHRLQMIFRAAYSELASL